jgi:tetratricopeptide (TPR) repeat protein
VGVLEAASGLGREYLAEALDEAHRAGLIEEVSNGVYRFAHALTQEAVYVELSPHRRAQIHELVGEALERMHTADPDPPLADLARHFGASAETGKAVAYATQAGQRAMAVFAFGEAAEHFEQALDALGRTASADPIQRCDLLLALGSAYVLGGHFERYRESFREASHLARRCGDAERFGEAVSCFTQSPGLAISAEEGLRLLEEALDALGPTETPLRTTLLCRLALVLFFGNEFERGQAVLAEATDLARRVGDPETKARAAASRAWLLHGRGRPEEVLEACDEALRLAQAGGFSRIAAGVRIPRIRALLTLGDLAEAEAEVPRLAQDGLRFRYTRFTLVEYRRMKALLTGRFDEAEQLIEETQELLRWMQDPIAINNLAPAIYLLRREQGRLSELEPGLRAWAEQHPRTPPWRCALAHLLAELGRTQEARREFESLAASDFASLRRAGPGWLLSLLLLAQVCVVLEDEPRAEVLYRLLEPDARLHPVAGNMAVHFGSLTRPLGSLAGLLCRFEEAERHFESALEVHRRMGARPWLAYTQHDFARMLRARGEGRDQRKALQLAGEALATARELGMVALAGRAKVLQQEIQGAIPLRGRQRRSG